MYFYKTRSSKCGVNFDIFVVMKIIAFLCICLPLLSFAQNDFETRYYTIDAKSLTDIPSIPSILDAMPEAPKGSFTLGEAPSYKDALNASTINPNNYWQPVDIASAMASNTIPYNNKQFSTSKLQEKQFGFSISGNGGTTSFEFSDGETRVKNDVYEEQGVPFLVNPYQSFYRRRPYGVRRSTISIGDH